MNARRKQLSTFATAIIDAWGREAALTRAFRRWGLLIARFILGAMALCAVFAPLIAPYPAWEDNLRAWLAAPPWYPRCEEGQIMNQAALCNVNGIPLGRDGKSYYFALGADQHGRDVLSRIIYGARISITLAVVAIAVGAIFGTPAGLIAGYYGGMVDRIIMRAAVAFSSVLFYSSLICFAVLVVYILGQSFMGVALALSMGAWAGIARFVRATVASKPRVAMRHLPAAVASAVFAAGMLQMGRVIVLESALSFLRAGVPPPTPSWGADISAGMDYFVSAWWVAFFPGMALLLTVLLFNFVGGRLRDIWELRLEQGDF